MIKVVTIHFQLKLKMKVVSLTNLGQFFVHPIIQTGSDPTMLFESNAFSSCIAPAKTITGFNYVSSPIIVIQTKTRTSSQTLVLSGISAIGSTLLIVVDDTISSQTGGFHLLRKCFCKCLNFQGHGVSSVSGYALRTKQVYKWEGKDLSAVLWSCA